VRRAESETFPGALAHRRLLVRGTPTAVEMRLRFAERVGKFPRAKLELLFAGIDVILGK
jgi:hypothetical protein